MQSLRRTRGTFFQTARCAVFSFPRLTIQMLRKQCNMNPNFWRYVACLITSLSMAACSSAPADQPATAQPNAATPQPASGVAGSVTLSPGCPGPQLAGRNCDQVLPNRVIELLDAHGTAIANATTGTDGAFSMQATPGRYTLQVVKQGPYPRCPPLPVTIVAGAMAPATVACDSGMR